MTLLVHIIIALTSVAYSTYVFFAPSQKKMRASYGLIAATLASGTYLVISAHAPVLSSCLSGLTYVSAVAVILTAANYKLAKQEANK